MSTKNRSTELSAVDLTRTGQRFYVDMLNGKRTFYNRCTITQDYNITVAGTGIRNGGSLLGMFSETGLTEGKGDDHMKFDPRQMRHFSEYFSDGPLPATRLTSAAIAAGTLRETFFMPLVYPTAARPEELVYTEKNVNKLLNAFLTYTGDVTQLLAGAPTVTLGDPQFSVTQEYDNQRGILPFLNVITDERVEDVSGANGNFKIDLRTSYYTAALLIQQDSDIGEVTDIINTVTLRGDTEAIIGPNGVPWTELVEQMAEKSGGAVTDGTYLVIPFVEYQRMSTMMNPDEQLNLRLELSVQPSVTAGATGSKVRVSMLQYQSRDGLTAPLPYVI